MTEQKLVEGQVVQNMVVRWNGMVDRIEGMDSEITRLNGRVGSLMAELAQSREWHRKDIARIGAALTEKAAKHDWCAEYDEAIDELNEDLRYELPVREFEYEVEVPVTVTIQVARTLTVMARNEEEARENANELVGELDAADLARDNCYDAEVEAEDDMDQWDVSKA